MRPDSSEIDRVGWFAGDEIPEHTNDVLRSMVGDALRGTSGIEREFRVDF